MSQKAKYLVSWVGGKRLLRPVIAPLIPTDIKSYIEPFGGGGWILFYKDKWADLEVYNDLDSRLVNLFRCAKYHPEELKKELKYLLHSRQMFMEAKTHLQCTDIQKAACFMFILLRSFGGKGETFGVGKINSVTNYLKRIDGIADRLDKVTIENLDFERLFKIYDKPGAFFYCDPPYTAGAGYATTSCEAFDHERLRQCLGKLEGRWLLSYDDSEMVRDLYKGFTIKAVSRQKGINNKCPKNGNEYREVLVMNYKK